ncbi:hypothetical protein Pla163_10850 [Planctomycetes bacterium Pla163]|uniref:Secreted protein n=1 Tax=Rohdeia mirabilis TaxID=2528008 RepID=A0A518CXN5_9BACT|nr:hypothetical protein Pla163_10850 [Planctomycetes bacterium Pla163]
MHLKMFATGLLATLATYVVSVQDSVAAPAAPAPTPAVAQEAPGICSGCDERFNGSGPGNNAFERVVVDVASGKIHVREKYRHTDKCNGSSGCDKDTCTFTWILEAWGSGGMGDQPEDTLTVEEAQPPTTPPQVYDLPEGSNNAIRVFGPFRYEDRICGIEISIACTVFNETHMMATNPLPLSFKIGCTRCTDN